MHHVVTTLYFLNHKETSVSAALTVVLLFMATQQPQSSFPHKLITFRLARFLTLVLRSDDFIDLPIEEAILINEIDKEETLCHIEFPDDSNRLDVPRVWQLKAWRESIERHEKAKRVAAQNRIEYDNYKWNINHIAEVLSKNLGMPATELIPMAQAILRKNKHCSKLPVLGIELREPYYRGEYVILPCRS